MSKPKTKSNTPPDMTVVASLTSKYISNMVEDTTVKMDDIVKYITDETGMAHNPVRTLVSALLSSNPQVTILRGKGGGVYKGRKEREEDPRERCPHCNQVIRKGRPRAASDRLTEDTEENDGSTMEVEEQSSSENIVQPVAATQINTEVKKDVKENKKTKK